MLKSKPPQPDQQDNEAAGTLPVQSTPVNHMVVQESFRRSHLSGVVYPNSIHYPPAVSEEKILSEYNPFLKNVVAERQACVSFSPIETTACSSASIPCLTYAGDEVAAALLLTELSL